MIEYPSRARKGLQRQLNEHAGRSRGFSMDRHLSDLNRDARGWISYFGLTRLRLRPTNCRTDILSVPLDRGLESNAGRTRCPSYET
jgi:hypothetical protein